VIRFLRRRVEALEAARMPRADIPIILPVPMEELERLPDGSLIVPPNRQLSEEEWVLKFCKPHNHAGMQG